MNARVFYIQEEGEKRGRGRGKEGVRDGKIKGHGRDGETGCSPRR